MKALSLKQPWAWLVCAGYKRIEFRWWSSALRGEIYIHASKTFDDYGYQWLTEHPELPGVAEVMKMAWTPKIDKDFGAIIGRTEIIDCMPVEQAMLFYPDDLWLTVAKRSLGSKAFILAHSGFLPEDVEPIPCKGKLGFFVPDIESSK